MAQGKRRKRSRVGPQTLLLCAILAVLTAAVLLTAALRLSASRRPSPEEVEKTVPDYVTQDFLTPNEWSRPGDALESVQGVVLHYVGNPATTAQANRNYFESLASGELGIYASSHFIVGLEGEVLQCIPLNEIAYASNIRNSDTISIEVCHPDEAGEFSPQTYRQAVELTAWLCLQFRLDPEEDVIRHYDVSGKLCPLYYVENPAAWDAFLADVAEELAVQKAAEP